MILYIIFLIIINTGTIYKARCSKLNLSYLTYDEIALLEDITKFMI